MYSTTPEEEEEEEEEEEDKHCILTTCHVIAWMYTQQVFVILFINKYIAMVESMTKPLHSTFR